MSAILAHAHWGFDGNWVWIWPVAAVLHIAFWALLIWLVVRVVRPWVRARPPRGPERVLAEKFAEGAISEQEYRTRLDVIRSAREGLR